MEDTGNARDRLIVALDMCFEDVQRHVDMLYDHVGRMKVGLGLLMKSFAAGKPQFVYDLVRQLGQRCFLDWKFHDIPNTVADASNGAGLLDVFMFNMHATAGEAALKAAVANKGSAKLLAVTLLTSMEQKDLASFGINTMRNTLTNEIPSTDLWPTIMVQNLVRLAWPLGVDGFVCSPLEVAEIRALAPDSRIVVPGIRPAGAAANDQTRLATPTVAIRNGATDLVVGRPVYDDRNPVDAAKRIVDEIHEALQIAA